MAILRHLLRIYSLLLLCGIQVISHQLNLLEAPLLRVSSSDEIDGLLAPKAWKGGTEIRPSRLSPERRHSTPSSGRTSKRKKGRRSSRRHSSRPKMRNATTQTANPQERVNDSVDGARPFFATDLHASWDSRYSAPFMRTYSLSAQSPSPSFVSTMSTSSGSNLSTSSGSNLSTPLASIISTLQHTSPGSPMTPSSTLSHGSTMTPGSTMLKSPTSSILKTPGIPSSKKTLTFQDDPKQCPAPEVDLRTPQASAYYYRLWHAIDLLLDRFQSLTDDQLRHFDSLWSTDSFDLNEFVAHYSDGRESATAARPGTPATLEDDSGSVEIAEDAILYFDRV